MFRVHVGGGGREVGPVWLSLAMVVWLNADMALNKFRVLEGYYTTVCIVTNAFGFSQVPRRNVLKCN